jgi:hypothetical protein
VRFVQSVAVNVNLREGETVRYFLFGGDTYYACGGAHDLISCGQNLQALEVMGRASDVNWWHVFDSHSQEIVCQSEDQAYGAGDK